MFILDDSHGAEGEGLALASHASGMRFLFVDFNAYFASVEQHDEPVLRGRPVLVTPLESEHSGAIAASYEAKKYGITRGTTVREARRLCPGIAIRPARHDRYVSMHHELMREIERHLPIHRICSVDECVCRLNPEEAGVEVARAKALEIKRGIYKNIGPAMRCSIGLASSSLLAKLASDLQKPDGLTVIETSSLPERLADLPLRAIPGVGAGIFNRLERSGVTTFTQLWNLQPKRARAIWNSVNGEKFLYALKGYDIPDLTEPKKGMIGHSRVLSGEHRTSQGARIVARALLLKAASRLRHTGYYAGAMTVSMKLYPNGRISHEMRFRATQNSWVFLKELSAHWRPMIRALMRQAEQSKLRGPANDHGQGRYRRQVPALSLKGVTVYLHGLRDSPPDPDLFVPKAQDQRDVTEAMLWNRIDALNRRYGMTTVMPASQYGLDLNYLGVKIAFSRVPDTSEFADVGGLERKTGAKEMRHESRRRNPAKAFY